jgi:hypothetical protein
VLRAVRALAYAPPAFGGLIATQWIEDGSADAIAAEVRDEMTARLALARQILGPAHRDARLAQRPARLAADGRTGRRAPGRPGPARRRRGHPALAPIVEPGLTTGVRLCLGAARDRAELERGLRMVAAALSGATSARGR